MSFEGRVVGIHTAPAASAPMVGVDRASLIAGRGIEGDRYARGTGHYSGRPHVDRQITLIEAEVLEALRRDHQLQLRPDEHRRNITTAGVPVHHLVGAYFWMGPCLLYGGRLNVPCKYLEELVDKRVFRPLVHRSGLNARIVVGGALTVGDPVTLADRSELDPVLVAANEQTPVAPAPEVI